ncbi:MAG: hypothetical protein HYY17_05350 [Planctomycetes bacterium]|nr:hypothetical protein [Planctomycetota bacterium]
MKVAFFSESDADEAAIAILASAVLSQAVERVPGPALRSRGWPSVRQILATVIQHVHYQTDASGLVVVADSNHSPAHQEAHAQLGRSDKACRMCQLREIADTAVGWLRPVAGRSPLRIAIGMAVPAIEAWYLAGKDPHVSEAVWIAGMQSGKFPYTKNDLKEKVYGTDRPSLPLEIKRAKEEATRLAASIATIETLFPGGFGSLADVLRTW